ncbi:hypothetical protein CCACVL1_28373 [Corchorus capsularis]|uniref:Uncharacterized protein n=1 Tax=Corchorus capsularis TaxID=210143 RepID=A0A1R3G6P7_COCAP|nr:hypothetical protein CCACVL1_28373 [Corchorus capsularis]
MAIGEFKDVENGEINGLEELEKPLIAEQEQSRVVYEADKNGGGENGSSNWMVLLCTFVAVCGSFEFGSCVGYSAPTQSAISEDLNLSLAEAMRLSSVFCIAGWLAVYFSKLMIVTGSSVAFLIGTIIPWRALALTAGTSFYLKDHNLFPELVPILAVGGVLIFPINVKGVAGSLVVLVNWLGAWAVSYTLLKAGKAGKAGKACKEEDALSSSSGREGCVENSDHLKHDIAQITNLRSGPHDLLSRGVPGRKKLPVSTLKMLVAREGNYTGRGRFSSADSCHILSRYLPVNGPWWVDRMCSRAYLSQFSADGSLFVAGFQRGHIRIYNVERGWKVQKEIMARSLSWTTTDACLSPDQRFLVYSTLAPVVHIVNVQSATTESVGNITEIHDGLDFSGESYDYHDDELGIFSVKFSTDGRELVAGGSNKCIYVYDLETNRPSLRIRAHKSDVNTVCFADETGHLIFSGSDDTLCKVWDRRCFVPGGKAAGVLMGHLEGITFIDSRGDGRYLISNGKDQSTKLWDIRKMSTKVKNTPRQRDPGWDYRWMEYPNDAKALKHPQDQSLATYRGHSVLHTLIRCYFSPSYSTGQKYIYTGSAEGSVYIYDLVSGAQVARLEHHGAPVRDLSWHPVYPMMMTSSWDGVIARWEFPGGNEEPTQWEPRPGSPVYA